MSAASSICRFIACEHARVGRTAIAGGEQDHVAGHQVARRDAGLLAVAQDGGVGRGHALQGLDRLLGAVLLDEAEHHREEHDDRDGDRLDLVAEEGRQDGGADQDQDQGVLELPDQERQGGDALGRLELVGPVLGERRRGLRAREPGARAFESIEGLVGGE